tara:strand:+ start:815 stop:1081 length:267 start_codon:yes stop_codon:yes gene_type:complete
MSKLLSVIILLSGLAVSASKYFAHSLNLFLLRSVITMSLQFLTFDKIKPLNKPIAPPPITRAFLLFMGLESSFSPSSTACKATAEVPL